MTNRWRMWMLAGGASALAVLAAGCKKKTDEIPVGAYLSLTGSDSTFGIDTKKGIELALDEINAQGGIKGKRVRLLVEDNKSTAAETTQKVQQLIDRDKVVAVLGEVASSRSKAGGLICNTKKVPMVTPSSTAVEVTQGRPYVFRTCFTDAQQGEAAARFVRDTLRKNTAGVFYAAQDTYSSGLAKVFRAKFEAFGGKVVIEKDYQKGETNFSTYLRELKGANPEIIFVPIYYNEMVTLARQAKNEGMSGAMFMGGDGWDSTDLLEGAGGDLEGAHFTNHYSPDVPWENSRIFITSFKAKYGHEPNSLAAQGYDAARVLFDAMTRATEVKPEAIREALAATKDFKGATGTMTMDSDRNVKKPVVVVRITGKAFKFAAEIQ